MKSRVSRLLALSALIVLLASAAASACGVGAFPNLFYILAWYPFIVIVDHLVYRKRGDSLIMNRPGELATMMVWSAGIWILFEGINLRLGNWAYLDVEPSAPIRYALGIISFATVLPGIFETRDLLDAYGLFRNASTRPFAVTRAMLIALAVLGSACLVLPLIWPLYCFPLIWGAFVFLLEPLNYTAGSERSLLRSLAQGSPRQACLLLLAGAVCGGVWESFNFLCRTRWEYHVPFVGDVKLFEMPVLGYLGFPPFSLECWVMYSTILVLKERLSRRNPRLGALGYVLAALVFTSLLAWFVFPRADRLSIKSFRTRDVSGRGDKELRQR